MSVVSTRSWLIVGRPIDLSPSFRRSRASEYTSRNVSRGSRRGGKGYRCFRLFCTRKIQLRGTCVRSKRSGSFSSPIPSHNTFSAYPSMKFHSSKESLDLRHLPNVGEDLNWPLQPKVVGLHIQLLDALIKRRLEEGGSRGDEVLCCRDSGISTGVNHPKRATVSFNAPDRSSDAVQRTLQ